jgi:hypothetical protein
VRELFMGARDLTAAEEVALRQIASQSIDIDPKMTRRLVQLALTERFRDGFRLTPLGVQKYKQLPKAPLQLNSARSIDSVLNGTIPVARAAGIPQPELPPEMGGDWAGSSRADDAVCQRSIEGSASGAEQQMTATASFRTVVASIMMANHQPTAWEAGWLYAALCEISAGREQSARRNVRLAVLLGARLQPPIGITPLPKAEELLQALELVLRIKQRLGSKATRRRPPGPRHKERELRLDPTSAAEKS